MEEIFIIIKEIEKELENVDCQKSLSQHPLLMELLQKLTALATPNETNLDQVWE